MNKIIIVGLPDGRCKEMERLLNACGMSSALPSRRENFSPAEIGEIVRKAHRQSVPSCEGIDSHSGPGIRPSAMWDSLALDLLIANIDQPLWGWSDSQSIDLLEYWRRVDPQIGFIFVYENPWDHISDALNADVESINETIALWCRYYSTVLRFFMSNRDRSILVHSLQARRSASDYVRQVRARLSAPLLIPESHICTEEKVEVSAPVLLSANRNEDCKPGRALRDFLASSLIFTHPEAQSLYEELEAVATLPLGSEAIRPPQPLEAWIDACDVLKTVNERNRHAGEIEAQLIAAQSSVLNYQREISLMQAERNELATMRRELSSKDTEIAGLRRKIAETERQIQAAKSSEAVDKKQIDLDLLMAENDQLLEQIHRLEERIEQIYIESESLGSAQTKESGANESDGQQKAAPKPVALVGASERIKRQLTYRLGATMITHSRSFGGWVGLPWALISETRRYRSEMNHRAGEKLPPISKYQDAQRAELTKRHLSYRLGASFLSNIRTPVGWLRLPFVLHREVYSFRNERRDAAHV